MPLKNVRGDLPALLVTPDRDADFPHVELPLTLAMTRSIGDFYMHTFGVTCKPEVKTIDLAALIASGGASGSGGKVRKRGAKLEHLTLILASDGIWDVFENADVFRAIVSPPQANGQSMRAARSPGGSALGACNPHRIRIHRIHHNPIESLQNPPESMRIQ